MNTQEYLARIDYTGELSPSREVLSALQEAHLRAVPFENLDIHLGRTIQLEPARLFQKIVVMKRGGFCYELNSLFHFLLLELGFHTKFASGRVFDRVRNEYGPDFDHMLNLVDLDGQTWLVDVGFGDFSIHPLRLILNQPLMDPVGEFLIEREDKERFIVSRFSLQEKRHIPEYKFSTTERRLSDFSEMCVYHQTSPESHFTQNRVCSIATAAGRITLTNSRLIITDGSVRSESPINNEREFRRALAQYFHIDI